MGPVSSPVFVGRGYELGELVAGLRAAPDAGAVTYLITGEAGVGKTRLVTEFGANARAEGAAVLTGGCVDVEEGRLPFGPFVEALRGYVRGLDPEARTRLSAAAGPELARLLPDLAPRLDSDLDTAMPAGQVRLFELFLALLTNVSASATLVLVAEDLHWADRSTRDLLSFLVRNLGDEPVVLIATVRSDELHRGHALRPFLAELSRHRRLRRLDLPRFTRDEVEEQIVRIRGGPVRASLVDSIFERSGGNPFFAEELLDAGAEGGLPATVRDIVLARVEQRARAVQEILGVVAVGGTVSDDLLRAVMAWPERDRVEAVREAVTAHLLVAAGSGAYRFRHALVRETLYQDLLPEERVRLHALLAHALEDHPDLSHDPQARIGDLARHWFAAHDAPRAYAASIRAAQAAEARYGFAEAAAHYERALDLWPEVPDPTASAGLDRVALALRTAESANLAGDHGRAAGLIRRASRFLGRLPQPALAGRIQERLGRYLWAAGDSEAALVAYERAVALVPRDPPSAARARVLAARAQALMLLGEHRESRDLCLEAIEVAERVGARAEQGHALNTLGCDLVFIGEPADAVSHLEMARAIAEEVGDLDDLCRAYLNLSDVLAGPLNRLEDALAVASEGIEAAQRCGLAGDYGVSLQVNAASALLTLGRRSDAERMLAAAERRDPSEMAAIDLVHCRARLDLQRGAFEACEDDLAHARALMTKILDPSYHALLTAIDAELALWRGRPRQAAELVLSELKRLHGHADPWLKAPLLWLGCRAEADLAERPRRRGDPTRSGRGHSELAYQVRALSDSGHPLTEAYAALCASESDRRAHDEDAQPWERCARMCEAVSHPHLAAYARWRQAETLLWTRRTRDATEILRGALALAQRIGNTPLTREIDLLAARARLRLDITPARPSPTSDATTHPSGLTKRQLEVLALVAAGQTNREIAQSLFITEKTAGAHVSSILATLGVRSRVEAATVAHRLGIVGTGEPVAGKDW